MSSNPIAFTAYRPGPPNKIVVPLTPVTSGMSRIFTDSWLTKVSALTADR